MTSRRRLIALAFVAIAALAVIGVLREMRGAAQERSNVERLRDEVRAARTAADSCAQALEREEAQFQAFNQEIDSLRQAVRDFESLHQDGVPVASYDEYITTFDRYNSDVPLWEALADSLRTHWNACRAMTERHNQLIDSLRAPSPTPDGSG